MAKVKTVEVRFKGWTPTQIGGGVSLEVTYGAELEGGESEVKATKDLIAAIRERLIESFAPIAKSRAKTIERSMANLPKADREAILAAFGPSIWLEAVMPELAFAKPDDSDGFSDLAALKSASALLNEM